MKDPGRIDNKNFKPHLESVVLRRSAGFFMSTRASAAFFMRNIVSINLGGG
uniref:Uncharacterized protein n=1 Tax=viral metagenome TaxID=1070528 RepID=A0A6H1ZDD8_9ZZZZ